jgi:hypothetical protein
VTRALSGGTALVLACALLGAAAPYSLASGATLKVKAPTTIGSHKTFNVVVSGTATRKHNYLALFFGHSKCKSTYAKENRAGVGTLERSLFVPKTFKVTMLKNVIGGVPGSGYFCTYLYPKASGTAWAFKAPEAKNQHKITFT